MLLTIAFLSFIVASTALSSLLPRRAIFNGTGIVPKSYIIQLKEDGAASTTTLRRVPGGHALFHKRALDIQYATRREFTNPTLFYGLSIDVEQDDSDAAIQDKLVSISNVEKVWPVTTFSLPPMPGAKSRSKATLTNAPNAGSSSKRATTSVPSTPAKIYGTSDVSAALKMSDVDKLHDLGIKGKGVKIGILDTGVDYRHSSLGGGFGPGYKIAGGYSYTDDTGNVASIADPLSTCLTGGHGTHVSGIIGMQDAPDFGFGLVGVAPEATIYMYRIFSCTDSARLDDILAALQQAHEDGVDLVSLSFGSDVTREGSDPFTQATSALVREGVAVIAAAGNDGTEGIFVPSSPAIGPEVIAVGSVDNTEFPLVYDGIDSLGAVFPYASVWPLQSPVKGREVYVLGGDGSGCDENSWIEANNTVTNPAETVIIFHNNQSECDFAAKEAFWARYGFSYIMDYYLPDSDIYDQQYVLLEQDNNSTLYTALSIEDGARIAQNYAKAGGYSKYKFWFPDQTSKSTEIPSGGFMSYFSSMGPTWDTIELKPQLSAPGGSILSTWPLGYNAGYAILRGTSMACPFVAGSYALVKSKFPDLSVQQIRELLQSTAVPIKSSYDTSLLTTVVQQGSGLVNPFRAIFASTSISPSQLQMEDTDNYVGTPLNFTITNKSILPKTYSLTHEGAGMIEFLPFGPHLFVPQIPLWSTQPQFPTYATVQISTSSVTLLPGKSATIFITFTPPSDFQEAKIPVISGFISVSSSLGESFVVPYEGLPYSRYNAKYINTDILSVNASISAQYPILMEKNKDGTFRIYNGSGIMNVDKNQVIPHSAKFGLLAFTQQPSAVVRIDLFAANTTFVPTFYGYDPNVTFPFRPPGHDHGSPRSVLPDGTPTYGLVDVSNPWEPYVDLYEWYEFTVDTQDEFETATSVGDYRLLLSVLKYGGNFTNWDDYQTWLSPIIRVTDTGCDLCEP